MCIESFFGMHLSSILCMYSVHTAMLAHDEGANFVLALLKHAALYIRNQQTRNISAVRA